MKRQCRPIQTGADRVCSVWSRDPDVRASSFEIRNQPSGGRPVEAGPLDDFGQAKVPGLIGEAVQDINCPVY